MTSAEPKKTERQQLATVVDLIISPARIRSGMDRGWVNRSLERENMLVKQRLVEIKKEGYPTDKPLPPKSPGRDAKEIDRKKFEDAKSVYIKKLKDYNDYESPRYAKLEILHGYCKQLRKLHSLLLKEKRTNNNDYDIQYIMAILNDRVPPKKEGDSGENDEEYNIRVEKFSPKGYLVVRSENADLDTPEGVQSEYDKIFENNSDLKHFFQKDDVSRGRVRFNDPAAVSVSAFMQATISQLAEHAIDKTTLSRKKIMQPDHCVSQGIETCSLFPLISNLPHYLAVVERQERKKEYEATRDKEKLKNIQQAKRKAKKDKKNFVRPKFNYPTFQKEEVKNGFAVETEDSDKEGNKRTYYQWYDIDIERDENDEHDINFQFYVNKVCRGILEERFSSGEVNASDIRVSNNLKKFLSDLITDFITRVTTLAMLLMENKNIKTINEKVILTAVRMILIDSYRKKQENMSLSKEHESLFNEVNKKIKKCKEHQTGVVNKPSAELINDDDDVIDDSITEEEMKGRTEDPTMDNYAEEVDEVSSLDDLGTEDEVEDLSASKSQKKSTSIKTVANPKGEKSSLSNGKKHVAAGSGRRQVRKETN
jgi:histone H3/H4